MYPLVHGGLSNPRRSCLCWLAIPTPFKCSGCTISLMRVVFARVSRQYSTHGIFAARSKIRCHQSCEELDTLLAFRILFLNDFKIFLPTSLYSTIFWGGLFGVIPLLRAKRRSCPQCLYNSGYRTHVLDLLGDGYTACQVLFHDILLR